MYVYKHRDLAGARLIYEERCGRSGHDNVVFVIMELKGRGMMPLYVGDDTMDEDAYCAIKGSGISISIGQNS